MPEWIWAAVGAGVAKPVPGGDSVALAGIWPIGRLARWQLSQVVLEGMCELGPGGDMGGMRTMLVMPAKVVPDPDAVWQATQLFVMPAWFMRELANVAPLGTGVVATLEPAPTWQLSHGALVGTWLLGGATILNPIDGIAKAVAAVALWHWAQLPVVLGALAWMAGSVGITEESGLVWHEVHCAPAAYGM